MIEDLDILVQGKSPYEHESSAETVPCERLDGVVSSEGVVSVAGVASSAGTVQSWDSPRYFMSL